MAGNPIKRSKKIWEAKCFAKPEFWEKLMALTATSGITLREFAVSNNIRFSVLYTRLNEDEELRKRFDDALKAKAYAKVDEIEQDIVKVEEGKLEANQARVMMDGRKWLASKFDRERFGEKVSADIKVTDMTALHLAAMEQLSEPSVIEGERVEDDEE